MRRRPTPASSKSVTLTLLLTLVTACDDATNLLRPDAAPGPSTDAATPGPSPDAAPSSGPDATPPPDPDAGAERNDAVAPDAATPGPDAASPPAPDAAAPPTPDAAAPPVPDAGPPPADAAAPTPDGPPPPPPDAAPLEPDGPPPDRDGDGVRDDDDPCPDIFDDGADLDRDGRGDACDDDRDGDGLANLVDLCPDDPAHGAPDLDADGDGVGDGCDADADGDLVSDADDNCPGLGNPDQADLDLDDRGDACDLCPADAGDDFDRDGLCADADLCPEVADPDQADLDLDGLGDACDDDADGDGAPDATDTCPGLPDPLQADADADGLGDACDPPACDDGLRNGAETGDDCGGPDCEPCGAGASCLAPADCASGVCRDAACAAPACDDGVRNGFETGTDCGGRTCAVCPAGEGCAADVDCVSGFCLDDLCRAPACDDRRRNGDETDEDCGGPDCAPCGLGEACGDDSDCDDADPCTDDRCQLGLCTAAPVAPDWDATPVVVDLSTLSNAEALAVDPTTGALFARAQQNPSGINIQLVRYTLGGVLTRFPTLNNLQSSNLSGLAVDGSGDLLFADETWAGRGRIASYSPASGAVRTVFATPWDLNPASNGSGQMRFAPDLIVPTRLFYFDGTTAQVYALDRSLAPAVNTVVFDADDGQPDGRHTNVGSDVRFDPVRRTLFFLDSRQGTLTEIDPDAPGGPSTQPWGVVGAGFSRVVPHPGLGTLFVSDGTQVLEVLGPGPQVRPVTLLPGVRDLAVGPNPARAGGLSLYALVTAEDAVYELTLGNGACFLGARCDDGLQNGLEGGVDCGGPCAPCEPLDPCASVDDCFDGDDCTVDACAVDVCTYDLSPASCPDVDLDGDGLLNGLEALLRLDPLAVDTDGNGLTDDLEDADGDTLTNFDETAGGARLDTDGDETPDLLDADSDDDTLSDRREAGDADRRTPPVDTDLDGRPDFQDDDSDGDRLPDVTEGLFPDADPDGDGVFPALDTDSDGDGRPDGFEGAADRDADGLLDFLDPQDLRVYSAHGVEPGECEGQAQGGLCSGPFFVDVVFDRPFDEVPHVLVAAEDVSAQQGCVGGATDKIVAYPANITREGFRLYAYGSPWGGNCDAFNGWASRARAGWLAIEAGPQIESAHNVLGADCEGVFEGGLCNGAFYVDIAFPTPYGEPPHVLAVPENVSNQAGCVGGATDQVVARAANITERGFRLYIHGSPMQSCGANEGWSSRASAGYLVVPRGPQIASAHDLSPASCTGDFVGGLCGGGFYDDIRFAAPLLTTPHVLTAPEVISSQGGCVGGATDKLSVYPEAVTPSGFRLFARGSPEGGSCGAFDGYGTRARAGWLAIQ
jgi:hypothetical protein